MDFWWIGLNVVKSAVQDQTVDNKCLQMLLFDTEAILNTRPITTAVNDPNDLEALTPNHLLVLRKKKSLPPGLFNKESCYTQRGLKKNSVSGKSFLEKVVKRFQINMAGPNKL